MVDVNKLPLSTTSFSNFILKNKIYVDKTDLIAKLALGDTPIFLSRPRRFDKSTLVSTFDELFSHGLEKFKGLKIDTQNLWQDKTYKVIHLDFSYIKEDRRLFSFENKFQDSLDSAFGSAKIPFYKSENVITSFNNSIKDLEDSSLVLLIDEYDAPLTAVMDKKQEFEDRKTLLSEFFLTIKRNSEKFRFIFITGVTRYSNVSIFSGFNNLEDISFNPLYGSILGYTQEELEFYFKDYLENAAEELNQVEKTHKYNYDEILRLVKMNYDGYSFDRFCSSHVYNPWSILNFLKYPFQKFITYWVDTGGAQPSLLEKYLETVDKGKLRQSKLLEFSNLKTTLKANINDLSPRIQALSDANFPFLAILYQAGYFTIKQSYGEKFKVGIPNLEIKKAFADIIVKNLTTCSDRSDFTEHYANLLVKTLESKNIEGIKAAFNKILNKYPYDALKDFTESIFRSTFNFACDITNLGIEVKEPLIEVTEPSIEEDSTEIETQSEVLTKLGRIDLMLEVKNYVYVIEFKVAKTLGQVARALKKACDQIVTNEYTDLDTKKPVVGLACVIVNQNKSPRYPKPVRRVEKLEEVPLLENKQ